MRARALVSALTVALPWGGVASSGCTTDSFDDCKAGTASRAECEAACRDESSPPDWCSAYLDGRTTDAGTDAAPGDGDIDAGPCGGCPADQVCDDTTGECVGCLGPGDCGPDTPVCDTEGSRTCVGCLADADCSDPAASRCDTTENVCVPCAGHSDCDHLDGLGICDDSSDPAECVECTGIEFGVCGGTVCDSLARTCSEHVPDSAGPCEPCVSDAHCQTGQVCVETTFDDGTGTEVEVGAFCLWREEFDVGGGPEGNCLNVQPYVRSSEETSIDGTTATVCSPAYTTCRALEDFREPCDGADDESCGVDDLGDGECVDTGGGVFRCNVPCESGDDCPEPLSGSRQCDVELTHDPPVCDFSTG